MASWLDNETVIERLAAEGRTFLDQHRGVGRALALRVRTKPYGDDEWQERYTEAARICSTATRTNSSTASARIGAKRYSGSGC